MSRPKSAAEHEHTPVARLAEAGLHHILGYQLAQPSIVTTQVFNAAVGTPLELRPVEFTILTLVDGHPGVTARQLARALAVTPPNIALRLERFETRALIARVSSRTDARAQHVRATAASSALARKAVQGLLEGEQHALASLSPAERAMLLELLHKVALARSKA